MLKNITITELLKLKEPYIIDIRSQEKYNDNHIPDAHNIVANDLLLYPDKYLDKDKVYYLYCQKGINSKKICQILNNKGYNLINVFGGYEAYILNN